MAAGSRGRGSSPRNSSSSAAASCAEAACSAGHAEAMVRVCRGGGEGSECVHADNTWRQHAAVTGARSSNR